MSFCLSTVLFPVAFSERLIVLETSFRTAVFADAVKRFVSVANRTQVGLRLMESSR